MANRGLVAAMVSRMALPMATPSSVAVLSSPLATPVGPALAPIAVADTAAAPPPSPRARNPVSSGIRVEVLRRHYAAACRASTWDITPAGTRWHWAEDDLRQIGYRVAVDAVALTGSGVRIGQCPVGEGGCGWLFVDRTRNKSRRWCSMADCGNATKARRLAAKRKAARAVKPAETAMKPG